MDMPERHEASAEKYSKFGELRSEVEHLDHLTKSQRRLVISACRGQCGSCLCNTLLNDRSLGQRLWHLHGANRTEEMESILLKALEARYKQGNIPALHKAVTIYNGPFKKESGDGKVEYQPHRSYEVLGRLSQGTCDAFSSNPDEHEIPSHQYGHVIAFDDEGKLSLPSRWRNVRLQPAAVNGAEENLQGRYKEIDDECHQAMEGFRYNNLCYLLEFMAFVRTAREKNPSLTLHDAHAMYDVDLENIAKQYKGTGEFGGDCFVQVVKLHERLKKELGIDATIVPHQTYNAPMQFPTINTDIQRFRTPPGREWWDTALKKVRISHASDTWQFQTAGDEIALFHQQVGMGTAYRLDKQESRVALAHRDSDILFTDQGLCPEDMGNLVWRSLPLHTEAHMFRNADAVNAKPSERVTFDFFNGVIRVVADEKGKLAGFEDFGEHKVREDDRYQVTIPYEEILSEPEKLRLVSVAGEKMRMRSVDALWVQLKALGGYYCMPRNFADNALYLLQHSEEHYRNLYPPAVEEYDKRRQRQSH